MGDFAGKLPAASPGQLSEQFYTQERCYISEYMNAPESGEVSVARCCVAPGVTTQLHSLPVGEKYILMQGQGLMELARTQKFPVGVGDTVVIPAGLAQRIKNVGTDDLVFLCICTPRFEPRHYQVLETADTPTLDATP